MQRNADLKAALIPCFYLLNSLSGSHCPSPACGIKGWLTQIDSHIHNTPVGSKANDPVAPIKAQYCALSLAAVSTFALI